MKLFQGLTIIGVVHANSTEAESSPAFLPIDEYWVIAVFLSPFPGSAAFECYRAFQTIRADHVRVSDKISHFSLGKVQQVSSTDGTGEVKASTAPAVDLKVVGYGRQPLQLDVRDVIFDGPLGGLYALPYRVLDYTQLRLGQGMIDLVDVEFTAHAVGHLPFSVI